MGFNKLILPEVTSLKEQLENMGEETFGEHWLKRMQSADAVMGPSDSHDFIKPFADFAYNKSKQIFVGNEMDTDIKK
jgi:hypothetical protein